ncbi:PD-(D/E)XK nuclease family protein [Henriciella sp.]|uniref:PD-(D/E)XK nuclease family protein n=1 Tax=Henriciella sp. TaxID=1968823 RepID=UPI002620E9BE|nr:PD-(D/E)XK nuclease family protein [Henriciella sp.]
MSQEIFNTFNVKYLSASSINKWTGDRGAWVAHYVYGIRGEVGPAAWRGGAVEDGLTAYVTGANVDPLQHAMMTFERDAQGDLDDEVDKERGLIEPMLQQAIGAWNEAKLGRPITQQIRIETWLDGVAVPLIGYADYIMDGYCLDLKTTKALPSKPKHDHVLQTAGYARARQEGKASLLYVTGKKSAIYDIEAEQVEEAISDLTRRARGLQNTLTAAWIGAGGDPDKAKDKIAEMCPPNIDHFFWSDADFINAQSQIQAWQ